MALTFVVVQSQAQDLTDLFAKDSLTVPQKLSRNTKVMGGVDAQFSTYSVSGIQSRRDPYNWSVGGNINFSSYGLELPFSFYFTNQNTSYTQPFNQFGVSPSYKWVKVHLGYRSLAWSDFTLNGHTFLGAGVELNPGILRFGAVYGRFRSAAEPENAMGQIPSYRRVGYALRLGFGTDKDHVDAILFHGQDDPTSISTHPDSINIYPGENLTVGLVGRKQIIKQVSAEMEWARSAYSKDIRSDETILTEGNGVYNSLGGLFTPRSTSNYNNAYKIGVNWTPSRFKTGVKYRRIEGEYQTMGSYFFQNDLEDITFNLGAPLANNKVNFNGSVGFQRNNLTQDKVSQTSRVIGSANVFWNVSQKFNTGLSYSNFSSTLRAVQDQITDSINYYQVSNTANAFGNYSFGSSEKQQSLMLNLSAQRANARGEYSVSDVETKFNNASLNYRILLKNISTSFTAGASITNIEAAGFSTISSGPMVGVNKELLDKKLRLNGSHSVIWQSQNGSALSLVNLSRLGFTYKPFMHHQFNLMATLMNKNSKSATAPSFVELRLQFGYRYSF